jgi:hypothetical protein
LGGSLKESAMIDNIIYVLYDLWTPLIELCFNKKWENQKTAVYYKLNAKIKKLEAFIANK